MDKACDSEIGSTARGFPGLTRGRNNDGSWLSESVYAFTHKITMKFPISGDGYQALGIALISPPPLLHPQMSTSDTHQPNMAKPPQRHSVFYLTSGDTIFLVSNVHIPNWRHRRCLRQAGNTLYRVHRHFLERESKKFAQFLSVTTPSGLVPKGSSESNPFILEDPAEDFENVCWVFYNP